MEHFIQYASLDVILFLVGMMIVVASMKESGMFQWLAGRMLKARSLSGGGLFTTVTVLSAVLSGLTGEAASIVVMTAIILDICDLLEINPVPLVISSVITTNIGSAFTLLGNPIGIIIALRGKLSFEDFLTHALPVSAILLAITIFILSLFYRNYIKELSAKLDVKRTEIQRSRPICWDSRKNASLISFAALLFLIAFHRRLEILLGLADNNILIIVPIVFAGIIILRQRDEARGYIEQGVEWGSLLFFMFLFVQAGVIQSSGIAQFFAEGLIQATGAQDHLLYGVTIFSSGLLSGFLDNTVVTASFVPVVKNIHVMHPNLKALWWCLLFGACLGGNLTAIGSTANIVALGVLEKQRNIRVNFLDWLKIGSIVSLLTLIAAFICISVLPVFNK
jgi:Na+/H+ antiporter NhaD/arsenite permease-like protein